MTPPCGDPLQRPSTPLAGYRGHFALRHVLQEHRELPPRPAPRGNGDERDELTGQVAASSHAPGRRRKERPNSTGSAALRERRDGTRTRALLRGTTFPV